MLPYRAFGLRRIQEFTMDEKTIEASPAPKQPYVRPQLHELSGSGANGKPTSLFETALSGPS
jgi:hypothetical protein